jgi:hypothetical protein
MKRARLTGCAWGMAALGFCGLMHAAAGAEPSRPAIYALVAGIDLYHDPEVPSLRGAVNDAKDVASALESLGAKVHLLTNDEVTARSLHAAWQAMQQEAPEGSLLIFHYAGHSADAREAPGPNYDGKYDFLLFSRFEAQVPFDPRKQPDQVVTGHQLRQWMAEAQRFRVLTVYDSCSSARLDRSARMAVLLGLRTPFAGNSSYRDVLLRPAPTVVSSRDVDPGPLPNQIFIAAAPLDHAVQEMLLDNRPRGALSYFFAKALRGEALGSGPSQGLTIRQLFDYIKRNVRQRTDQNEDPILSTLRDLDEPLLDAKASSAAAVDASLPAIAVHLLPGTEPALLEHLAGVKPVDSTALAMLQLDLGHQKILNGAGQIVVEAESSNPVMLQGVINKWRYFDALARLAEARSQAVHLGLQDDRARWFYQDAPVTILISGVPPHHQVAVFDLTSIGTLDFLYPGASSPQELGSDGTLTVVSSVTKPYGADHVVVITADDPQRMKDLVAWLDTGKQSVDSQGALLQRISGLHDIRVGVQWLYTCASESECPRADEATGAWTLASDVPERGVRVDPSLPAAPPGGDAAAAAPGQAEVEIDRKSADRWEPLAGADKGTAAMALGTVFRVCATPRSSGYLTLWVADRDGAHQVYPNAFRGGDVRLAGVQGKPVMARNVSAGQRICVGDGEDFELVVSEPLGRTQVRYILSRDARTHAEALAERVLSAGPGRIETADAVDCRLEFDAVKP